jgi:hypothetical protein
MVILPPRWSKPGGSLCPAPLFKIEPSGRKRPDLTETLGSMNVWNALAGKDARSKAEAQGAAKLGRGSAPGPPKRCLVHTPGSAASPRGSRPSGSRPDGVEPPSLARQSAEDTAAHLCDRSFGNALQTFSAALQPGLENVDQWYRSKTGAHSLTYGPSG